MEPYLYAYMAWKGTALICMKKDRSDIFILNYSNILTYDAVSSGKYLQLIRTNVVSLTSW
jgi:hypothetical protein